MSRSGPYRVAGFLFLAAAACFLGAALIGHQPTFYALVAVFAALAAVYFVLARGGR